MKEPNTRKTDISLLLMNVLKKNNEILEQINNFAT